MYEYLDGEIVSRSATGVVLDVNGVGFEVAVPVGAKFESSPRSAAGSRVWTHFVVRETSHTLYGFPTRHLRELFRMLLQVRGVGPSLGQAILSSMRGEDLLEAIAAGDVLPLTRIKGVGKKTAAQILLDLKDRAPKQFAMGLGSTPSTLSPQQAQQTLLLDAASALVSIGYTEKQAQSSVEKAIQKTGANELEEIVRAALRE